jgi:hypothetical protein
MQNKTVERDGMYGIGVLLSLALYCVCFFFDTFFCVGKASDNQQKAAQNCFTP